jgi:hypothetical protein
MPYKDRERYLSTQRGYYKKNPEAYKWRVRLNNYGITKEQFFEILDKQDNKCALCNKPFESLWGNHCHIDHCHETDKVRGLLCMSCNVGLGMLGDTKEKLMKAINYLEGELR